jgi:hypothetical protein
LRPCANLTFEQSCVLVGKYYRSGAVTSPSECGHSMQYNARIGGRARQPAPPPTHCFKCIFPLCSLVRETLQYGMVRTLELVSLGLRPLLERFRIRQGQAIEEGPAIVGYRCVWILASQRRLKVDDIDAECACVEPNGVTLAGKGSIAQPFAKLVQRHVEQLARGRPIGFRPKQADELLAMQDVSRSTRKQSQQRETMPLSDRAGQGTVRALNPGGAEQQQPKVWSV